MVEIYDCFYGRINASFGLGTNFTNDFPPPLNPFSMVVKVMRVNGHPGVKLSNNLAKASGPPEEVERYKRAAGYTNTESVACTY